MVLCQTDRTPRFSRTQKLLNTLKKKKKKRQREVGGRGGRWMKKKVQGEMLLLALYKSRRHSNTLLLNKSIWLSLKAWILPNDETFGAVMLVAKYWTYWLYMMFLIIKLKLTQLYIYVISLIYRTLLCYGDYQVCFAMFLSFLFNAHTKRHTHIPFYRTTGSTCNRGPNQHQYLYTFVYIWYWVIK